MNPKGSPGKTKTPSPSLFAGRGLLVVLVLVAVIIVLVAIIFTGFPAAPGGEGTAPTPTPQIPNPAAVYCKNLNYTYEIRTNPDGSQYGVCILPDGTECDEWSYYRGICPRDIKNESVSNPAAVFCLAMNHTYTMRENPEGGLDRVCVFSDGRECDVQAYYEGTCNETTAVSS